MRTARLSRAKIALATVTALALTATVLAQTTSGTPPASAADPVEPRFLAWEGEPFADGRNHFLITASPAEVETDGWLKLGTDNHLVTAGTDTPQDEVRVGEIEDAVTGTIRLGSGDVLQELAARGDVHEVRSLGFHLYAVSGSIEADELRAVPGVSGVTVDSALRAASVDPYYPSQWALDNDGTTSNPWAVAVDADIDAPEGWHRTRGSGVVVAVVDSGVDIGHPDLAANIWHNTGETCDNGTDDDGNGYVDDCTGWDFANSDATVDDQIGHGTHVAGIIAAQANNRIGIAGVAYEAEVMVLKIGDGTPALSAAIEAIGYAIDNGAKVINASWLIDDAAAGPYLDVALAAAEEAGILFVTGAGNEPIDLDTNPVFPASSPAGNVVVTGASTATDRPAEFSGFGATTVDLFAPGEHIISTIPGGYGVFSGTSMAAPMVAGAAALLWAATPEATVEEVKGALLDLSDSPDDGVTAFRDLASSDGRLNIGRSIYTQLFQPSLMFDFHEFNTFTPGTPHKVAIIARTVDPWIVPAQTPVMYRAGLYVPLEEQPMAVVGHEITYTGAGGDLTVTTDTTGRALVGRVFEQQQRPSLGQEGDFTPLAMELPAGTYAFVMEIVDTSVPEAPITLGDPSAVFFIVHEDGTVSEMPDPPPASVPTTSAPGEPEPTVTSTTAAAQSTTTALTVTTIATPTSQPDATTTTATAGTPTTLLVPTTTMAPAATTTVPAPPTTTTSEMPATTTSAPAGGEENEEPPDLCSEFAGHDTHDGGDDDDDNDDDGDDDNDDDDDGDDDGDDNDDGDNDDDDNDDGDNDDDDNDDG
ncbi:MAG: S8 family peptidase, partial [Acidimicrobiia bacterium]|nr:S8 family peptidase [Acidimicrobiia bacterium]